MANNLRSVYVMNWNTFIDISIILMKTPLILF